MVEAAIVIASFVLFFMAIVYFRKFYTKQIRVGRLARASTIAYSMGACEAKDPGEWARPDISPSTTQATANTAKTPVAKNGSTAPGTNSNEASSILNQVPGAGSDDSFLNPIGHLGLSTEARSSDKPGKGFKGTAASTSFVSCGDKVREGQYDELVDMVTSAFPKPKL
jgi:hypothetical protein